MCPLLNAVTHTDTEMLFTSAWTHGNINYASAVRRISLHLLSGKILFLLYQEKNYTQVGRSFCRDVLLLEVMPPANKVLGLVLEFVSLCGVCMFSLTAESVLTLIRNTWRSIEHVKRATDT